MEWIDKPRRVIIRDIIVMSLNQSAKKLEYIAGKHQLDMKNHYNFMTCKDMLKIWKKEE